MSKNTTREAKLKTPADYLQSVLKKLELTQVQAAEAMATPVQNLSRYYHGHRRFTPKFARRLEEAFGSNNVSGAKLVRLQAELDIAEEALS